MSVLAAAAAAAAVTASAVTSNALHCTTQRPSINPIALDCQRSWRALIGFVCVDRDWDGMITRSISHLCTRYVPPMVNTQSTGPRGLYTPTTHLQ
ncbi:hypothetical protein HYFRA_00000633 [Hymenoscyphus fraxineus]|uniref:Secreted protein n=1 Tax=Hymenoscyphus fraxineus TaxID=746836 RepID=A0A9N9L512_9HELO|nr:hypothetical protein HYFRA_00000633 [Hymenoscyphus fraxineus]